MALPQYEPPQVETYTEEQIVESLGPVATADSSLVNGDDPFNP